MSQSNNGDDADPTEVFPFGVDLPADTAERGPVAMTQEKLDRIGREAVRELPKRFYKDVRIAPGETGHSVLLDGRNVKTPGRNKLEVPLAALADAMAAEWRAQGERIDPADMPFTRLSNTILDGVTKQADLVRDEIVQYAGSDLLCYRAPTPDGLVARQNAHWNPWLDWAASTLGAELQTTTGLMPIAQSATALQAVRAELRDLAPFELGSTHVLVTIGGSTVLALAVLKAKLAAHEAWTAAHVDEDWQIGQWGADDEAATRRALRWTEFEAAAQVLHWARTGR